MIDKIKDNDLIKNILSISTIFLLLLFTQYMIPINLFNRVIYIYYVEVLLIILFGINIFYIFFKKKKLSLTKKEFIILLLFILWFFILTIYRYIVYKDITGGFVIFRTLTFPIVLAFLLRQYNLDRKNILYALLIFVTYINILQINSLITVNSFRALQALANINIYLCFMLSVIPLIILFMNRLEIKNKITKIALNLVGVINIILICIFSMLSGSRVGLFMCPIVCIFSHFCINKFNKKSIISFVTIFIIITLCLFTIIKLNVYDSRFCFSRAASYLNINVNFKDETLPNDKEQNNPTNDKESNNNDKENNDNKDDNLDDIIMNELEQDTSITDSNNMRNLLWEKSIYHIKQNPIFGKSSTDIEIDMYFTNVDTPVKMIQSPHNFILEIWLALGLPGMILYFVMIFGILFQVMVSKIKLGLKINLIVSLFAIFGFSFFQPLVTSYFVISLTLWIILYIYCREIERDKL